MTAPAAIRQADIKRAVAGVVAGMRAAGISDFRVGQVEVAPDGRIVVIGAGPANDSGGAAEWDESD